MEGNTQALMEYDPFGQIAPMLNQLIEHDDAEVRYDALSDALYWSDEFPWQSADEQDFVCLQPVLRFRMTLILGNPNGEFQAAWDAARRLFPQWPGFRSERRAQDADLAARYWEYHRRAIEAIRSLPD